MCTISRINIELFINIRNNPLLEPCTSVQNRSEILLKNHRCFTEQYTDNYEKYTGKSHNSHTSKWRNNNVSANYKKSDNTLHASIAKRPVINNDSISHREFISILNKITNVNQQKLIIKVKDIIKKEHTSVYVLLLWDMMLRCPDFQNIYINIIDIIRNTNDIINMEDFKNIWSSYILEQKWLPDSKICLNINEYDEFCDFMKWKKRANAAINGFMLLVVNNIVSDNIVYELTKYIVNSTNTYMTDELYNDSIQIMNALLEQILSIVSILKIYKCNQTKNCIIEFIKNNESNINHMSPSNKFKFIDIIENLKQINLYRINR